MAGRGQPFLVDSYPEKQKIVDGILAGKSVRAVAKSVVPPIQFNAIQRYKTNVVIPMLQRAEKISATMHPVVPLSADPVALQGAREAIQDAPTVSLFRHRLEKLYRRVDRALDRAETAVRVIEKDGKLVAAGADLGPIAPLLSAAHRNLEMLGRATGELEPAGSASMSIQIICPAAGSSEPPRIVFGQDDERTIEGEAIEVEPVEAEIGISPRR
jgi:hypothetical protein